MDDEEELPVVSFGNLMSEGTALSRLGLHHKALGCFNDVRGLGGGLGSGGGQTNKRGTNKRDVSPGGLGAGGDPQTGQVRDRAARKSREDSLE